MEIDSIKFACNAALVCRLMWLDKPGADHIVSYVRSKDPVNFDDAMALAYIWIDNNL